MNRAEIKNKMSLLTRIDRMSSSERDEYRRLEGLLLEMDATEREKRIALEVEQAKRERAEEKKRAEYEKKQESLQTTF